MKVLLVSGLSSKGMYPWCILKERVHRYNKLIFNQVQQIYVWCTLFLFTTVLH